MRVVVIASLEPEHLRASLRALLHWVPRQEVLLFNNATLPHNTERIQRIGDEHGVAVLRAHDLHDGENSIDYINEVLRAVSLEHPDEVILKIDEDVVLVSEPERFACEPGVLLVPNVTVNNYTTRDYLAAFWPDLDEALRTHDWMWHRPHPFTGGDYRLELLKRIYTIHPRQLMRHCREEGGVEYLGAEDWARKHLMSDRGISSTAVAFRGSDYTRAIGDATGIEEVLMAQAVRQGLLRYKVDHSIFCHHINYNSVRAELQAHPELVAAYNERIFAEYGVPAT